MGRPKGSKNREKTPPSPPAAAANGIGHNAGPEDDQDGTRQALALQHLKSYEAALEEKKAAAADFLSVCRAIKAELGKDGVKLIKDMILISTPEGEEELKARAARARQAARYMAAELGTQFSFFTGDTSGDEHALSAVDRAYDEGRRDGAADHAMTPDYPAGSVEFQNYATGWHEGQAALKVARGSGRVSTEEAEALETIDRNGIGPAVAAAA